MAMMTLTTAITVVLFDANKQRMTATKTDCTHCRGGRRAGGRAAAGIGAGSRNTGAGRRGHRNCQ